MQDFSFHAVMQPETTLRPEIVSFQKPAKSLALRMLNRAEYVIRWLCLMPI